MKMEDDSIKGEKQNRHNLLNARDVLQPAGLRRLVQNDFGLDWELLGDYWNILLCGSAILWSVFLLLPN
jgi:hypothetical protein